jgi:uncharacterized protein YcnI
MTSIGYANQTQLLTFGVGHGCEGLDTVRIEVRVPEAVTSVRGTATASWGEPTLVTNDANIVTSVVWSKEKVRAKDDGYYQFNIRVKVPDAPFTTLYFPAKQTCRGTDGKEVEVDWAALPEEVKNAKAGEEASPAPALTILPVRAPGWNKFKVTQALTDLSIFKDALIVWAGDAAYSGNPTTLEQIKAEKGVTELTELKADTEIWVKY